MVFAVSQRIVYGGLGFTAAIALGAVVVGVSVAAIVSPATWVAGAVLGLLAPSFKK